MTETGSKRWMADWSRGRRYAVFAFGLLLVCAHALYIHDSAALADSWPYWTGAGALAVWTNLGLLSLPFVRTPGRALRWLLSASLGCGAFASLAWWTRYLVVIGGSFAWDLPVQDGDVWLLVALPLYGIFTLSMFFYARLMLDLWAEDRWAEDVRHRDEAEGKPWMASWSRGWRCAVFVFGWLMINVQREAAYWTWMLGGERALALALAVWGNLALLSLPFVRTTGRASRWLLSTSLACGGAVSVAWVVHDLVVMQRPILFYLYLPDYYASIPYDLATYATFIGSIFLYTRLILNLWSNGGGQAAHASRRAPARPDPLAPPSWLVVDLSEKAPIGFRGESKGDVHVRREEHRMWRVRR